MQKIQNTQFTISTNKMFNNSIFIKTNTKNNLTYMCSSMQKVANKQIAINAFNTETNSLNSFTHVYTIKIINESFS